MQKKVSIYYRFFLKKKKKKKKKKKENKCDLVHASKGICVPFPEIISLYNPCQWYW